MNLPFVPTLEVYLINSLRSEVKFFIFYYSGYTIFLRKREPKIFGFSNVKERGIKKFSLS